MENINLNNDANIEKVLNNIGKNLSRLNDNADIQGYYLNKVNGDNYKIIVHTKPDGKSLNSVKTLEVNNIQIEIKLVRTEFILEDTKEKTPIDKNRGYPRFRPFPGGSWIDSSSKGNVLIWGPAACWVRDVSTEKPFVLSSVRNTGETGEVIFQSSKHHTEDRVGIVIRHNELKTGGLFSRIKNVIDASIAAPIDPKKVVSKSVHKLFPDANNIPRRIRKITNRDVRKKLKVFSTLSLSTDQAVRKISGFIIDRNYRFKHIFRKYSFKKQILVSGMKGQIGSGVFTDEGDLVGIVTATFHTLDDGDRLTVVCRADKIAKRLNIMGWEE